MTKKRTDERRAQLSERKHESQEKKAKKRILKSCNEDNIAETLKRIVSEIESSSSSDNGKWVSYTDGTPTPRAHSTLTTTPSGTAVMFGGELYDGNNVTLFNDTFLYNIAKNEWKVLNTSVKPVPRCSHQAAFFNNRIYIYGGEYTTLNQFHHFNDMHCLCLRTLRWSKVDMSGDIPSPRSGHRMVIWNNFWLLFGGFYDNNKEISYHNDLYLFNFKESKWTLIDQRKFINSLPAPRASCLIVPQSSGKYVLMYGGFSKSRDTNRTVSGSYHQDSWLINMAAALENNGTTLIWERINITNKPQFCTGFGYSFYRNFAVVFGGVNDIDEGGLTLKSTFHNTCYLLNADQRKWYPLIVRFNSESEGLSDILSKVTLAQCVPSARMNSNVIVHDNTLLIYGGIIENKNIEITLSDLWSLDLNKRDGWKCISEGHLPDLFWKGDPIIDEESDDISMDDDSSDTSDGTSSSVSTESRREEAGEEIYTPSESETWDVKTSENNLSEGNLTDPSTPQLSSIAPSAFPDERLSDYYVRTRDYWLTECLRLNGPETYGVNETSHLETNKKLRSDAFEKCREYYDIR